MAIPKTVTDALARLDAGINKVILGSPPPARTGSSSGGGSAPVNSLYFASNEVPFADSVLTADFNNGYWYKLNADQNAATGKTWIVGGQSGLDWGGTIFGTQTPTWEVRNLASIGKQPSFTKSPFVATTGTIGPGQNQNNNAWHNLSPGSTTGYNEIYCRAYKFFVPANYFGAGSPAADYVWGGQKSYTINRTNDDAGIYWAGVGYNVGQGGSTSFGTLMATNNHASNIILHQNITPFINEVPGHWYYEEFHIKLNTNGNADGVFEMWINDGGANGDFSGQTPTKRASFTNVDWGYTTAETKLMGVVWAENWSNNAVSASQGEQLWANFHVRTAAPVGFAV